MESYSYNSQNRNGKKNRRVKIKFLDDSFEMEAKPRFGNLGDPAATVEQVMETNDPITALITFALEPRAPGALSPIHILRFPRSTPYRFLSPSSIY